MVRSNPAKLTLEASYWKDLLATRGPQLMMEDGTATYRERFQRWFGLDIATHHFGDLLELGPGPFGSVECTNWRSAVAVDPLMDDYLRMPFPRREGVRRMKGFAEHLPFPDASFDSLVAFNVIDHVQEVEKALQEIARVLRPAGAAYIYVHVYRLPLAIVLNIVPWIDHFHDIHMTPRTLRRLLGHAGLRPAGERFSHERLPSTHPVKARLAHRFVILGYYARLSRS